ncbi:hypothetical protein J5X07_04465 [Actinomyces bowdenii]|uniref:hypothetical protein n=1 Tax=Actinomyces bowdenii TaxID=131109 RepID=UPI001ABC0AFD|nr:hypothetical protein [Actinomyces bowdenii]MBO3724284.1 hypothetical protein [Actinomyces bowdenii]
MHLAMVETNGNQAYIFATQRQRDQIGASYLLSRLPTWFQQLANDGTHRVLEVVSAASGKVIWLAPTADDCSRLITALTSQAAVEAPGMDVSGVHLDIDQPPLKPRHLAQVHDLARQYTARRRSPSTRFPCMPFLATCKDTGLPACPPRAEDRLWAIDKDVSLSEPVRVKRSHSERLRDTLISLVGYDSPLGAEGSAHLSRLLGTNNRLRHAYTMLLGEQVCEDSPSPGLAVTNQYRLERALGSGEGAESVQDISPLPWVCVIHIDGNGVGALLGDLQGALTRAQAAGVDPSKHDTQDWQHRKRVGGELAQYARVVSSALEEATFTAFILAWHTVVDASRKESDTGPEGHQHRVAPLVPVLVGGDDVTIITDAQYGFLFTAAFLHEFETTTAADPLLRDLDPDRPGQGMCAAAGIAVIKRAYPFHSAYRLAEELCSSAKRLSRHESTLDFHVLHDSSFDSLEELRRPYQDLTARPYYLRTPLSTSASARERAQRETHSWAELLAKARVYTGQEDPPPCPSHGGSREMAAANPDSRGFPRTRVKQLRTDLAPLLDPELKPAERERTITQANRYWAWLLEQEGQLQHQARALGLGLEDERSLFLKDEDGQGWSTALFDCMELVEKAAPSTWTIPVGGQRTTRHEEKE